MDVLGRNKLAQRALGAAALAALAACAIFHHGKEARAFAFSHERHVVLEKLECANCHADALAAEDPGMPSRDTCDACHAEIDGAKPPERRIDVLFTGDKFAAVHASKLPEETIFSHQRHASAKLACNQ